MKNAARRPRPAAVVIMEGPVDDVALRRTRRGRSVCRVSLSTLMVPDGFIGSPNSPESGLMPAATMTRSHSMGPRRLSEYLGLKRPFSSNTDTQRIGTTLRTWSSPSKLRTPHSWRKVTPSDLASAISAGMGRHLLQRFQAEHLHGGGFEAKRGAGGIDGDVAATDHDHSLALHLERLAELGGRRNSVARVTPSRSSPGTRSLVPRCVPMATRMAS